MPAAIVRFRIPVVGPFPVKSTRHIGVISGGLHQRSFRSAPDHMPNEAFDTATGLARKSRRRRPGNVQGPSKVHNPNPSLISESGHCGGRSVVTAICTVGQ